MQNPNLNMPTMPTPESTVGGNVPVFPAADNIAAVCVAVVYLGTQADSYQGVAKENKQVILVFETPEHLIEIDGVHEPRVISKRFTYSFSDKANLRKMLKRWRGHDMTPEEMKDGGGFLFALVGKHAYLDVVHNIRSAGKNAGKPRADIDGIRAYTGQPFQPKLQPFVYSVSQGSNYPPQMFDWMKEIAQRSKELNPVAFEQEMARRGAGQTAPAAAPPQQQQYYGAPQAAAVPQPQGFTQPTPTTTQPATAQTFTDVGAMEDFDDVPF